MPPPYAGSESPPILLHVAMSFEIMSVICSACCLDHQCLIWALSVDTHWSPVLVVNRTSFPSISHAASIHCSRAHQFSDVFQNPLLAHAFYGNQLLANSCTGNCSAMDRTDCKPDCTNWALFDMLSVLSVPYQFPVQATGNTKHNNTTFHFFQYLFNTSAVHVSPSLSMLLLYPMAAWL